MNDPAEFREVIIRPVLQHLGRRAGPQFDSPAIENLLLGTAIQESHLESMTQDGGGPGLSYFQIEPATFYDIYDRYLPKRPLLLRAVNGFLMPAKLPIEQLDGNQYFACAVARMKFWMSPTPLPAPGSIDQMGKYWKTYFNSPKGRGTAAEWALNYRKYVK